MGKRAKAGASVEALVEMAIPLLQQAERQCPRIGPGRKPTIPDWLLGEFILRGCSNARRPKRRSHCFLTEPANRHRLVAMLGCDDCLSHSK